MSGKYVNILIERFTVIAINILTKVEEVFTSKEAQYILMKRAVIEVEIAGW